MNNYSIRVTAQKPTKYVVMETSSCAPIQKSGNENIWHEVIEEHVKKDEKHQAEIKIWRSMASGDNN